MITLAPSGYIIYLEKCWGGLNERLAALMGVEGGFSHDWHFVISLEVSFSVLCLMFLGH